MNELEVFLAMHSFDPAYLRFKSDLTRIKKDLIHSDIWSMTYDFVNEFYPELKQGDLITQLTYYLEEE